MFKIKELPEKITTNVVAQAIVTGGLLVIGWVVGLASNLPAWAYLPLALVIIGAALWIINQLAQIRGRQKKEVSHKIHSAKGEVYEDEVIILAELLGESHHTIEECVFRSCLIKGPVLIVLEGNVQFQGKGDVLADSVEDILYEVDEGRKLSGAIKVLSCTFRDCRFQQCGFVGTKTQMDVLRKIFARS